MKTFQISSSDKELLAQTLKTVESLLFKAGEVYNLDGFPPEKILTFLYEVNQLSNLDNLLKENFQPNQNPYEEFLDAVGENHVVQQKEMGGTTYNSRKINMRPGVIVSDYVRQIVRSGGKKKAVFAVRNRYKNQLCVVPVISFKENHKTFISWDNFTSARGAKVINLT